MFKTIENHNYIKESLIKKKIEKAELTPSEIENNEKCQEIFFKYMLSIHPIISYYDIIYILHEKYNTKKVYKQSNFNNYKNSLKQENKNYNSDNDLKLLDNKEKDLKKPNDSHPVIFF